LNETSGDPALLTAESLWQTGVSEITRQIWTLLCLVILECVGLAGLSAVFYMRRASRNLAMAAWLMVVGVGLTIGASLVITQWAGYVPLTQMDYVKVIAGSGSYAVLLILLLALPGSLRYARALHRRASAESTHRPAVYGWWYIAGAVFSAAAAMVAEHLPASFFAESAAAGQHLSLPFWYIIRWVLVGWSAVAVLLALAVCLGRSWLILDAYVFVLLGLFLQIVGWGVPFALNGPEPVLIVLSVIVAVNLIVAGRMRDYLDAKTLMPSTA